MDDYAGPGVPDFGPPPTPKPAPETPTPDAEPEQPLTVSSSDLLTAIRRVWHARARVTARPVLTAVYLTCKKDGLYAVTADNYRLAKMRIELEKPIPGWSALIPTDGAQLLMMWLRTVAGPRMRHVPVNLTVSEEPAHHGVGLTAEMYGEQLRVRLMNAVFPDYEVLFNAQPSRSQSVPLKPSQWAESLAALGRGVFSAELVVSASWSDPLRIKVRDYEELIMPVRTTSGAPIEAPPDEIQVLREMLKNAASLQRTCIHKSARAGCAGCDPNIRSVLGLPATPAHEETTT